MFQQFDIEGLLYRIPVLFFALSIHEFFHGWVAYKLGDATAKLDGRLSLNPLRHLDPVGALCMLFFRFGWAKPVMVDTRYFKNPRRDLALVSAAGPASNFILAFVSLLIYVPVANFSDGGAVSDVFKGLLSESFVLNISLGTFNLIPFPPLDGSKILAYFLPANLRLQMMRLERYGFMILLLLTWTRIFNYILSPIVNALAMAMYFLVDKIFFFL